MIDRADLETLARMVGPDNLLTNQPELAPYATDGTKLVFAPDAVIFPGTTEQTAAILRLATEREIPVIPRGAGTGMSGGALPVHGGLVMSLEHMNRILEIDRENLVAKVEPGVITAHLQEAVENVGLFYPPDPASLHISTIGGNVAECAGGLRAVKYGVTRDYVLGLTVVLPTGDIIRTGVETMKGVAGYDLTHLIVGSEGTLAVVTSITLRLLPKPETQRTMLAFFPDVAVAALTVSRIIHRGIIPTILEFMDRVCLDCIREEMAIPVPADAGAMLLMEVDGNAFLVEQESKKIQEACEQGKAISFEKASTREEAERLWQARREISPSLYKLKPHKTSEDIVVPRSRLPELIGVLGELSSRYGLPLPAFGHAGDGNIHVNIMHDKDDPRERGKVVPLVRELFEKILTMGGTITGEHGIGITKAPYLEMEIPKPGLDLMSRIKKAFDPRGILNPGKILLP
ncbi:MAG: FAD-binding protein [Deltaproteobacteria bacterium]|nr:FAD-binding protein [Deltaproteobacteria bacterium]